MARLSTFAALLALASLHHVCQALRVDVSTVPELRAALNDTSVRHVFMLPTGSWNFTDDAFPANSVHIMNRSVTLEGGGPGQLYLDMNKLHSRVIISKGGNLSQINIWGDDCYFSTAPYSCFIKLGPGGWASNQGSQVSDAGCTNLKQSVAISTALMFYRFASLLRGGFDADYQDDRTVLIKDTGWLMQPTGNAYMRVVNTSFTCTGNVTHMLPPAEDLSELPAWQKGLLLAGGVAVAALSLGVLWCWYRARDAHLPEYRIAESRGFTLAEPLGSGHFGRVYRGTKKGTGQAVAIKVINLLPSQRLQLEYACRECQHLSQVHHECIVEVVTFYAAQVRQRQKVVEPSPGIEYVELGFKVASVMDGSTCGKAGVSFPKAPADKGGKLVNSGSTISSTDSGGSDCTTLSGEGSGEGVLSTQVQLVMQYCDLGTLDAAVKSGRFHDAETGLPKLSHILATALEIARGLEYLHHADRRMVHRDLSANNVLLNTATADDRGYRALLSDFGLSTSLSKEATHKTSEVKGTLSYMSPELFLEDSVSPALDIYSLGIIMHLMFSGKDPYIGQVPAQIILSKVRATETPEEPHLPLLGGCPEVYQELVSACTYSTRQSRPTAAAVVRRLKAMLQDG